MKRPAAVLMAALLFASAASLAQAKDFELAIPLPLTGQNAKFGEIQKKSYEIAAQEINAAGGVKGMKLVLSFEDSTGKPETARAIVEKLIDVKKQPIIVGEYTSACAKAVAAVAEERKTPYLIVSSADDDITQQKYKYVFRMNQVSAHYADGLTSFLREVMKPKTMAIIYESSPFGTSGSKDMAKQAEKAGIKVLINEKYESGQVDFKPILSKVKAANPDVIFMVSYVMDAALLMKQIKELRIDARLFAGGAAGFHIPEFVDNAKDAAEYVVTSTLWTPQLKWKGGKEYADKFRKKYGDYPSYHGSAAYSAMYVVKDALERAKSWKQDDIRNALRATNIETAFGPVKFEDKEGYQNQNFSDTYVRQVINGHHQTVYPQNYANAKFIYPIPKWRERK